MKAQLIIALLIAASAVACSKDQKSNEEVAPIVESVPSTIQPVQSNTKMVHIPGGEYEPFYGVDSGKVYVAPFYIDEHAVTNAQFLEFVKANPQYRKSKISSIFTDSTYLRDWPSDLELPKDANPNAPVTFVSWFAAKAYAKSVGKRLPKLDEWEFIAMADKEVPNARKKASYSGDIVDLYLQRDRQYQAVKKSPANYWGVYNMFDLIWEWTDDFNSVLDIGDSRTGQNDDKNLFCAGGAASARDIMNYAAFMRFGMRTSVKAEYTISNLGFRCAKDSNE